MKFFISDNMPMFIKKEMEQLQNHISPIMTKMSKYMFWATPLKIISFFNLFLILFLTPQTNDNWTALMLYAVLGAVGMALSKETKHQQAELHKLSVNYIVERIKKSDIMSVYRKEAYFRLVKEQPFRMMNHFINFLREENERRKRELNLD
ncbi:DUF5392 family protein [Neobacillus sp. LXY-4]|uniref:DUF5392 family protein n=1 Tax=Neobacillus sp. LXY-4 TaxID=3379826 RepID=UPI003EDF1491